MTRYNFIFSSLIALCIGFVQAADTQKFPDVVDALVTKNGSSFRFDVTFSSPYDTAKRYADAYRIKNTNGFVYGIRELSHHHGNEQPFTRSISGVNIPNDVTEVIIEGRDKTYGWGGATLKVTLPK
jgi:hypothetical protein